MGKGIATEVATTNPRIHDSWLGGLVVATSVAILKRREMLPAHSNGYQKPYDSDNLINTMLRIFTNLLRLELKKQRAAFQGILILTACLSVIVSALLAFRGIDFDEIFSGVSAVVALCGMLAAMYLGISSGRGLTLQASREVEDDLPAPPVTRAVAAYSAGLLHLGLFVLVLGLISFFIHSNLFLPGVAPDLKAGRFLWVTTSLVKLELFCFLAACWIPLGAVAAFLSIFATLVDSFCSLTLIVAQDFFSANPMLYEGSEYLVPALLLVDILLIILTLCAAATITSQGYGKPGNVLLSKGILPVSCLLFGPVACWLIFHFLMTPAMQAEYKWGFLPAVFFEAAHTLGFL